MSFVNNTGDTIIVQIMIYLSKPFSPKNPTQYILCLETIIIEVAEPTLLVSVATVALMLLADNKVIFSLARPRKDARG